ncbi:MAG: aminotransferase class V-fold PLP-dependent enzyme [Planctomycetes bacterium]|nr:aminotransferase class V-fold PLP-dependent enzyme [Planctomycetota bacterium]
MLSDRDLLALRAEFPALARRRRGKPPIYLNSTCMSLRPQPVVDALVRYYAEFPTCGGGRTEGARRLDNWFMEELREHEEAAREAMRALLKAERVDEVVWTRNTTEAINLVARGFPFEPGDRIVLSEREHNSNLVPWLEVARRLRERAGDPALPVLDVFDLAPDGAFDLRKALAAIGPRTRLVALGHASNLDGTTIPDADLRAVADAVHRVGGVLLLDAAQSVPHRAVDVRALGADFLACSVHKMCGPTGVGVLWGRYELLERLAPHVVGGDTIRDTWHDRVEYKRPPGRFEAGLQDYAGIAATAAAVDYVARRVGFDTIEAHERRLNTLLSERLRPLQGEHFWLRGPADPALRGGVLTMTSPLGGILNTIQATADREWNVMLRKGMFCVNAYLHRRFDADGTAKNNLRASMYFYNTEEEVETLAKVVERVVRDPLGAMDDE